MNLDRFFAHHPLLRGFPAKAREELLAASRTIHLDSGRVLYEQGSEPQGVHLIVSGRLRAQRAADHRRITRELGRGELVGGVSWLAGTTHRTTVRAIRDTTVLEIPAAAFEALLDREPAAGRGVVRAWLRTLLQESEQHHAVDLASTRTIAVLPAHAGAPSKEVAHALTAALARFNLAMRLDVSHVDAVFGAGSHAQPPDSELGRSVTLWLNDLERRYRYLVYDPGEADGAWTQRCLRQADRVLLVAEAARTAQPTPILERLRASPHHAGVEVVLFGEERADAVGWRDLSGAAIHHRVRGTNVADGARLARMLSGRGVGLALGGGGARGFAHIGLIKALQEFSIEVDVIAGSSMGALIGALLASGMPAVEIEVTARGMFVERNLLNDYTVPRVSLIRARKARSHLESLFGDTRVEDLLPYFACVTTNLTQGRIEVHDLGRLAHWVGASMSVPGIAPPVIYRGDLLVDGGVLAPLPSDLVADLGRGPVIASDVSSEEEPRPPRAESPEPQQLARSRVPEMNIFQILYRAATVSAPEARRRRAERADLYLRMPVAGVGMFDWDAHERLVEAAYRYSVEALRNWRAGQA